MLNQIAIRSMIIVSFLLSVDFPGEIAEQMPEDQLTIQEETAAIAHPLTETEINELLKVTTSTSNVEANPLANEINQPTETEAETEEVELTEEEKLILKIEQWQADFPTIEDDSKQARFINAIAPAAVIIAHEQGIFPSVMIAQAGLESAWGTSGLAKNYNNLMGTKGSWNGNSVTVKTREDINGQSVYINAGFSVYDSWKDSLNRYGHLLRDGIESSSEFYKGTWRENASAYQDATAWLQGRYATDTAYASKLNQTIQSFNLDRFDDMESPVAEFETAYDYITAEIK